MFSSCPLLPICSLFRLLVHCFYSLQRFCRYNTGRTVSCWVNQYPYCLHQLPTVCEKPSPLTPISEKGAPKMPKLRGVYPVTGCEDEGADEIRAAAGMKQVVPEVES